MEGDIGGVDNVLKMILGDSEGLLSNLFNSNEFAQTFESIARGVLQKIQEPPPTPVMLQDQDQITRRTKDLVLEFPVSLLDLYRGKNKKIVVKRKQAYEQSDGSFKLVEERKTLDVNIKPGTRNNHKVVFPNEADFIPGFERGDVVIILKEKEHPIFIRCYDDLLVNFNISISELYYFETDLTLLDGSCLSIRNSNNDLLSEHGYIRKIPNRGMPIFENDENKKGDLFIQFTLVPLYNDELPDRQQLMNLFPSFNVATQSEMTEMSRLVDDDYYKLDLFEENTKKNDENEENDDDEVEADEDEDEEEDEVADEDDEEEDEDEDDDEEVV